MCWRPSAVREHSLNRVHWTFERDERRAPKRRPLLRGSLGGVGLVGADLADGEILGRSGESWNEVGGVVAVPAAHFDGGDDVGTHPAHGVELHPILAAPLLAPLRRRTTVPSGRWRTRWSRRRNPARRPRSGRADNSTRLRRAGVISGDRRWRSTVLKWGSASVRPFAWDSRTSNRTGEPTALRRPGDTQAKAMSLKGHPGAPKALLRARKGRAQVSQHREERLLLLALSPVVAGPLLGIGDFHFLGHHHAVRDHLVPHGELDGEHMLAIPAAGLPVGAGAGVVRDGLPWSARRRGTRGRTR